MRCRWMAVLGLLSAVSVLVGCGADGPEGRLAAAMELTDAQAGAVRFDDVLAIKQRHGVDEVTSSSSESERNDALAKLQDSPLSRADLWSVAMLNDGWGWSAFDLDWSAEYRTEDDVVWVLKLRDSLDFDQVRAGLVDHGYTEDGDSYRSEDGPDAVDGRVAVGTAVRVDAERHLITSRALGEVPEFVEAEDSLARSDLGERVLADLGAPEHLRLGLGDDACSDPARPLTQAQIEATPIGDFAPLEAVSFAMTDDTSGTARSWYTDEATAGANLAPHQQLLEAQSLFTQMPYSDLGTFEIEQSGRSLEWTFTMERAGLGVQFDQNEGPWGLCGPRAPN